MDKSQVLEKAIQYATLVNEKIKPLKVILYGSYVKDNWKEESDIDIAVVVGTIEDDFLEMEAMLYRLRRSVDDRIEPVLLEAENDESGFLNEVLKHGKVIYSV
ncbi:MAG: nucleotidyltransferase domain-containing protein [Clostridia bacterium]